jgi:hypothetical protein
MKKQQQEPANSYFHMVSDSWLQLMALLFIYGKFHNCHQAGLSFWGTG